ncbi:MAG: RiPP maturation radical SAM C-methyltransferase, partial [Dehalococcoidia bacterium]
MSTQTIERVAAGADDDQPAPAMRVALVNMPFASTRYGSIQLGLLQAILRRRGIPTTVHYLNLRFAQRIGWEPYEIICNHRWHSLGEWIFSRAAFTEGTRESQAFLEEFPDAVRQACESLDCTTDFLVDLREREAPAFIEECIEAVPWDRYDVVGFGSLFEQNCAALALARRIKERFPHLTIVFGGSNFEDEMGLEYVRTMPWIDYAVIGEGDEVFPTLLDRLAKGEHVLAMPGVACRGPDGVVFGGRAPMVTDLDALPEPDYDDYFTTAAALPMPGLVFGGGVQMLFESGRGCWWGAKHHCTFC